jgi:aminoglycoside N3'-acetyltransferase
MVHASLRSIGPVDGGADGVIDALEAVIGPQGTLFMNIGARDDWDWVNERPEGERAALLRDAEPFDAQATPADPDNGVLAEIFRTRPGTIVSDHPDGRFGARGRHAIALTRDVPWDHYYGPGSPLQRFTELGGRVLRLGADRDTVTLLHYAEYLAPVPEKRRVRRHHLVATPGGAIVRTVECLDDSDGIVDDYAKQHEGEDYFATILGEYLATGRATIGRVGDATSELIDATDIVAFGADWMGQHLGSATGGDTGAGDARGGDTRGGDE